MKRNIIHCDLNSFYASVEMQRRPELRDKPVAVCGDPEIRHGIVLAASYPAKTTGVKTGQAIWQAKSVCPDLLVLSSREYIRSSKYAREIYEDYTDQVESFGLDECWLDVTGSTGLFGNPIRNMSAYIRKMCIDGYTVHLQISELDECVKLLRYTSNNVNQIARRVNSGGGIYPDELDEINTKLTEDSGLLGNILERLSKIK